ncbi:myristoylated alanine-rich C-kinase substrate-like [Anoplophora glabripennis]|uniref:myristoylated alanine-rich C-kinase substrate-like n=1 Tax=Anoplophora glabripennis TaxID=217634 RepID=UPI0008749D11|nr:myristoylated alanine-rich C-kinase substrate-like [Anoplophora glabripennis]
MEDKEKNIVNVPTNQNIERPGSEKDAMEVGGANPASPGSPSKEEELLKSSEGETEGSQECDSMDTADRETRKKEKRREKRNKARAKRRREVREARKGLQGTSDPARPSEAQHFMSAPADSGPGTSTSKEGFEGTSNRGPAKPRGPQARRKWREDNREAKRRSFVLPTAPAAVREGGPGGPKGQPGPSTQTSQKRSRADKTTPPER